jgi:hypothetical protein
MKAFRVKIQLPRSAGLGSSLVYGAASTAAMERGTVSWWSHAKNSPKKPPKISAGTASSAPVSLLKHLSGRLWSGSNHGHHDRSDEIVELSLAARN